MAVASLPIVQERRSAKTSSHDVRLATAFEELQELYFLSTAAEGLEFAVRILTELVPCDASSACIYDINTHELRFVALEGAGAAERRAVAVPATAGLFGAALHSHEDALLINDTAADLRFDAGIDGRVGIETRNAAYFPLRRAENQLGVIQLLNRKGESAFSDSDVAVASYVATQVGEFLQSRRTGLPRRS